MRSAATAMNSTVLKWARTQMGLSIQEAAARIKKSPDVLESWEAGAAYPTYNQLEALAMRVYKRPIALFFLPAPPEEAPPASEFRTLPDAVKDGFEPDTWLAVREAEAFRLSLVELTGGINPTERPIWREISGNTDDVVGLAANVRKFLGISLLYQMGFSSQREANATWREAIEAAGIFVFKRSMKQRQISGFCHNHSEFPVIVINNSTAFSRQTFTLFHELAHILFSVSSVTRVDSRFVEQLSGEARDIEIACNQFAAEFLMPAAAFPWNEFSSAPFDDGIESTAKKFSVSREVVLRRLLDDGRVSLDEYHRAVEEWFVQFQNEEKGSGGNYYNTQTAYLGRSFLDLAFGQFYAGRIALPELAEHLGIRARSVGQLEETLLARR